MATYKNVYELAQKRKNKDDFVTALAQLKDYGSTNENKNQNNFTDSFNLGYTQAGGEGNGLNNLGGLLGKGLANLGSKGSSGGSGAFANALSSGSSGSAITDAINGVGGSGSAITDAINTNVGGSTSSNSGGFWSNFGGGSSTGGGGGSVPWALIANIGKKGYNAIAKKDDKDYSDVEESIIYPLQGAAMGASYSNGNPWAAAGGALYGLGYSFKDDLGLKDSNFLTQMLFPIGMGDDGGLRIGGESILDLG